MKNKIAKKLIFSAVALGASVLTLTTTTYAWYVQNNTVTATSVTGKTKSNDAGSLFITKDGSVANPSWGPTIEFESSDFDNSTVGNAKGELTPLRVLSGGTTFMDVNGNQTMDDGNGGTVSIATGKVITVSFWLMSSKDNVKVQPTLQVKNTTGDTSAGGATKVSQTAYSAVKGNDAWKTDATRNPDGKDNVVEQGGSFWVDATQALRMSLVTTPEGGTASSAAVYDVLSIAKSMTDKNTPYSIKDGSIYETDLGTEEIIDGASTLHLKGAHAFYHKFVGGAPTATFDAGLTPNTTWDKFTIGTTKTKFTFTFWLEGTDEACFDSCASQSFEFAFDFTVTTA